MKKLILKFFLLLCLVSTSVFADKHQLDELVKSAISDATPNTGYSFHVIGDNSAFNVVVGNANPKGDKLTPKHVYRIASVTKSFTASAALRLVEMGKLNLEDSINDLVTPVFNDMLQKEGYDTNKITLKQIMSHTAGIFDHPSSEKFINSILSNPQKVWTRKEQIQAAIDWGEPVGAPGEKFVYSDTGYVILGDIIERAGGEHLPVAVRKLINYDKLNIHEAVWEIGDSKDVAAHTRVHQYLSGQDTYDWDPTMDMFGGGGLVASPTSMARFYHALFAGQVFEKPSTLTQMLSSSGLPDDSPYLLGVFKKDYQGLTVYEHGGFWGTSVMHHKPSGITIAGAALKQEDYRKMIDIMTAYLRQRTEN